MTARIIDGKAISAQVRADVAEKVAALETRGITPGLAAVLVGDDPASHVYVGSKERACAEVGMYSERVSGGIAYLADSQGSLEVVDVSTPSAPRWVSLLQLSGGAYHVAVEGTRAVLITEGSSSWLDIIDIAQPSNPVKISSVVLGTPRTGKGVTLTNGLAYVAASGKGLQIYGIGAAPTLYGVINDNFVVGCITAPGGGKVVVVGNYTPTNTAFLQVLDVTIPEQPRVLGELSTTMTCQYWNRIRILRCSLKQRRYTGSSGCRDDRGYGSGYQ